MKRITVVSLIAASFFLVAFDAPLFAITINDYTITNYHPVECAESLPEPMKRFDARYDEEICFTVKLDNVYPGDTIEFKWYFNGRFMFGYGPDPIVSTGAEDLCQWGYNTITTGYWQNKNGCVTIEIYLNGLFYIKDSVYLKGLPPGHCIAEEVLDDENELSYLRTVRDDLLSKTPEGRMLIRLYYLWSPVIVGIMDEDAGFKTEVKEIVDALLPVLGSARQRANRQ